jgi:hypothetical protein
VIATRAALRDHVTNFRRPLYVGSPPACADPPVGSQFLDDLMGIWEEDVAVLLRPHWHDLNKSQLLENIAIRSFQVRTLRFGAVNPDANAIASSSAISMKASSKLRHHSSKYTRETSFPLSRSANSSIRVMIRPRVRGIVEKPFSFFRSQISDPEPGQNCSRSFSRRLDTFSKKSPTCARPRGLSSLIVAVTKGDLI